MDLIEILRNPEGQTLEFKQDLSSPDGIKRTAIVFANTAGGTILIGVEDKTGYVHGVADPLALEERVASLINDSITPRVLPDIELLSYRDTQVVAVRIYPSASRPHYSLPRGSKPEHTFAWARPIAEPTQSSSPKCSDSHAARPLMSNLCRIWTRKPSTSESFADVRKLRRRDLETLRLLTTHRGHKVPTVGGMLLFGQERLTHFPDAWIQAGRFKGSNKATILEQLELRESSA